MDYKNGRDILPSELLEQLQGYVQGNLVYVPKKEKERAGWGESNGTKRAITNRNYEIHEAHESGIKIPELASRFCLSEESIRKILRTIRKKDACSCGKDSL